MYCSSCGIQMGEAKLRCQECRHFTPSFWLNSFSLLLLLTLVATDVMYLWKMVPIVAVFSAGMGFDFPLVLKLFIKLSDLTVTAALALLVLAFPAYLLLRGRKIRISSFVTSGKLLALVAWVTLVISLVGIIAGFTDVLVAMPRLVW